jgi:hypothetical protein
MPIWGYHMIKAMLLSILPLTAQAGGWEEFQARCLDPYENLFPPIVDGLEPVSSSENEPAYRLSDREVLVIELTPEDAASACRLDDQTGQSAAAFDEWISSAVAAGRYEKVGPDTWNSFEWIEPRVAVQKRQQGGSVTLRVMETELES